MKTLVIPIKVFLRNNVLVKLDYKSFKNLNEIRN